MGGGGELGNAYRRKNLKYATAYRHTVTQNIIS